MAAHPRKIEGPCNWTGADIADDPRWRFSLSEDDIAELERVDAAVAARSTDWREMTRDDFPLDGMAEKFRKIQLELEDGCGMARLSKLPVDRFAGRLRHIWHGIDLNLGTPLHQDFRGMMMRDIEDKRQDTDALFDHKLTTRDGKTFKSSKARTLSNGPLRLYRSVRCRSTARRTPVQVWRRQPDRQFRPRPKRDAGTKARSCRAALCALSPVAAGREIRGGIGLTPTTN